MTFIMPDLILHLLLIHLPDEEFMFRYYIHGPWWVNSPWYDRYNGCPHDIYLPMAISRIDEKGNIKNAQMFNILSIDNSFGDLPEACVYEPLPHILKAEKDSADAIAPFVWVYPMREFTTSKTEELLYEMYYGDRFICDAINNGFPLNCVVSSDNFLKTPFSVYKGSIIISPFQPNTEVSKKINDYAKQGGKVIYYSSTAKLSEINNDSNILKVDIKDNPEILRKAIAEYKYEIIFDCKKNTLKPPAITIHRSNNAMIFSVYNPNTTTDTLMKFPLGAPILDCGEAELVDGFAKYRFSRAEHRECRVFVKQKEGVVSVKEMAPGNGYYRRKILIRGLQNADVCLFPEHRQAKKCDILNFAKLMDIEGNPIIDSGWKLIEDENGIYYNAENITGDYQFCMPF